MHKNWDDWIARSLSKLFKTIWSGEEVSTCRNENKVNLLDKGGHKSENQFKNYRPVSLSDTVGMLFCGVMNTNMKIICERANI